MRRALSALFLTSATLAASVVPLGAVDEVSGVGAQQRLSSMGTDGDVMTGGFVPAVAHGADDRYLVVWYGDTGVAPLVDDELEVWSALLDDDGDPVGEPQRLSAMGPDGDADYDAIDPAVAFDAVSGTYLVVWTGDTDAGDLVDEEDEIWARRVGADGAPLGEQFRVSVMGPDGDPAFAGREAAVAADVAGGWVVVWSGDTDEGALVDDELEIWSRRVESDGAVAAVTDRVSLMGPDGDPAYQATDPAIATDPVGGGFVTVWSGDTDESDRVDDELEIWARPLSASGNVAGAARVVSAMGPDGDAAYDATFPDVAVAPDGSAMVVWQADDDQGGLADDELEVWAQPVTAAGEVVGEVVRVSAMGPDGDAAYHALRPAIAHNPQSGEYLVVWNGDTDEGDLVDDEFEVWARRVAVDELPAEQLRVSEMGPDGDAGFASSTADVAHGPTDNELLVVWWGDTVGDGLVDNEAEVFGQFLAQASAPGAPREVVAALIGPGRVQLSWEAPAVDGGSDITGYRVSSGDAALLAVAGSVTSVIITGLEPGDYSFSVEALNVNGASPAVESGIVTLEATGYWLLESDGTVYPFGNIDTLGSAGLPEGVVAVDIVAVPDGSGYWVLDSAGRVLPFGDATDHGSVTVDMVDDGEIVTTLSSTPTGLGYWVFTDRGRALPFGDATDIPDLVDIGLSGILNGPIIDSVATPSGQGYYMIGSDGGVFSLGDAEFHGSMGGTVLNQPVNGIVPDPDGVGYWLVAGDGGVFSFEAEFRGSVPGELADGVSLNAPVIGMVAYGDAYLMVGADGGVFNFSDLPFVGSLGSTPPDTGVVSIAA
ncbi:MAG: fibronectin type III domain-containing protein [Actinomycetota bacterium]